MKKFIKFITFVLTLTILFTSVTACKPKQQENKPEEGNKTPVVSGVLVDNGTSPYRIIISKDYTDTIYFAATEMQNFINQATGVSLPISLDTSITINEDSRYIFIGKNSVLTDIDSDIDYSKLNGDGFILRSKDDCLFINGANDRGTLYGVYDYLEKCVGVRFLTADYTYVPSLTKLDFYTIDHKEIPAFPLRVFLAKSFYTDSLFAARMRMTGGEHFAASEKYGGGANINGFAHNTISFVPTGTYFSTAEDKVKNAHMYNIDSSGNAVDICFTDGVAEDGSLDTTMELSAAKVAIESLKNRVRETSKDTTLFFFAMQDTTVECQCNRCLTRAKKYLRSGNVVRMTNLVSKEVNEWCQKEYDGRRVELIMFAYNQTVYAPVDGDGNALDATCIPNEYVHVRIAPINQNQYYSVTEDKNFALGKTIDAWGNLTPNIMVWNYHTFYSGFACYFPTQRTWKADLKRYQEIGATYMLMQSDHVNSSDWQDKMDIYVASKMLWNTDSDITALQNEFIDLYYGKSAQAIKEVMGRLDEKFFEVALTNEVTIQIYQSKIYDTKYYPIAFLEGLLDIINAEIEKATVAGDTALVTRLNEVKLTPLYMIVRNVKSYYADSQQVYNTVKEFVDIASTLDFSRVSEGKNIDDIKIEYGIK